MNLTPKLVFFQVRSFFLRYAYSKGARTNYLPAFISHNQDDQITKNLQLHLKKSLIAYEENNISLAKEVSKSNILLVKSLGFITKGYE